MAENETQNMLKAVLIMQAEMSASLWRIEQSIDMPNPIDGGHRHRLEALEQVSVLLEDDHGTQLKEALGQMIRDIRASE